VLEGLIISTNKICPRRKEIEEIKEFSKFIHGLQWIKVWMDVGHSEAKHGCP
jgi:hypothetical protein